MISVCMATYNGAKFLREQVDSILYQLGDEDELIVSDDGSTDETLSIIQAYNDKRVKLHHNQGHHGVNGNFENALRNANGDYIFLSDQDDVWIPGKVKTCIEALSNCDCVIHNATITDGNLNPSGITSFEMTNTHKGIIHNWIHNGYLGCAMAFRREILKTVLPIPIGIPMYHDIWIGTLAGIKYKVKFIDFVGIKFRRHDLTTSNTAHNRASISRIIKNRLGIIYYTFRRLAFNK